MHLALHARADTDARDGRAALELPELLRHPLLLAGLVLRRGAAQRRVEGRDLQPAPAPEGAPDLGSGLEEVQRRDALTPKVRKTFSEHLKLFKTLPCGSQSVFITPRSRDVDLNDDF